jgi:hypothetical protein
MGGEFPPPTHINPITMGAQPPLDETRRLNKEKEEKIAIDMLDLPRPVDVPLIDKLIPLETPGSKLTNPSPRRFV